MPYFFHIIKTSKGMEPWSAHINTIAAKISSPIFVRVSKKQLVASY